MWNGAVLLYRYCFRGAVILFLYFFFVGLHDGYAKTGLASWYSKKESGDRTANGEAFDDQDLTAAHRRLPFNTRVRVTNLENHRSIEVRINDRGPFIPWRIIDLTKRAATDLGMEKRGVGRVRLEVVGR